MEPYKLVLAPTPRWTRVLLTHGPDELLRAVLPPPSQVRHARAAPIFLESLASWLDSALPVVLSVAGRDAPFCLGLTDELGVGLRSLYYRVEVSTPEDRRRRAGTRLRGVGDFSDLRQLRLVPDER
jgi:hypothetical protein